MTEKTWTVYIVSPKENWLLKYILEFDSKEKAIKFGKGMLQPDGQSYYISRCPELDETSLLEAYTNEAKYFRENEDV